VSLLLDDPPKLAPADLRSLWRAYRRTGDEALRERLVLTYAPLVKFVAGRLRATMPAHVDEEELISCGLLGLLSAIERYDPDREAKFETFAIQRIRGSILDGLRAQDWVPRSVRARARLIERTMASLQRDLGRTPSDAEVAAKLGVTLVELDEYLAEIGRTTLVSLDEIQQAPSENGDAVRDSIEDDLLVPVEEEVENADRSEQIAEAISQLPERERMIIALYYYEGLMLREIGEVIGVTESRVSQLHTKAVLRLRSFLS
jgi:RNA polymerase sigma factor for flagellar operon FliA